MTEGGENVIVVSDVSKEYNNFKAVKEVSFSVQKNTIFGLLGSNGAGKSTMMYMLTGLLNKTSGSINILGQEVKSSYSRKLKQKVAIVPQEISLYQDLTIYDNLYFFGNAYLSNKKEIVTRINELAMILQLGDLDRRVKNLSGGYQRRVSLAVGLIGNPEVLILDEVTVGIDLETRKIIIDLLQKLKSEKTIVMTTHLMEEAEQLCDKICFMHRGVKLKEGNPKDILVDFGKSSKINSIITFGNDEHLEEVKRLLIKKGFDVEVNGNRVIIESSSNRYELSNMVSLLKGLGDYSGDIMDIRFEKPNLGDVLLYLIKKADL